MKKYAFFGGSFNPPTIAHKTLAIKAAEKLNLDKVFFVPVGDGYKKDGLIDEKHRFKMLQLICNSNEKLDCFVECTAYNIILLFFCKFNKVYSISGYTDC